MWLTITPSAMLPFDCTAEGIKRCHGDCCIKLKAYWPMRAYPNGCPYVTPKGCSLSMHDRTIDCLLYPLFINGKGTLQVHNHCYHKKWMCHENLRVGPPMIDALHPCLVELFGQDEYDTMHRRISAGKNYGFRTSEEFSYCRMVEDLSIKYNLPIIPRSKVIKDFKSRGTKLWELMEANVRKNNLCVSKHYHGGY